MRKYRDCLMLAVCWGVFVGLGSAGQSAEFSDIVLKFGFTGLSFEIVSLIDFTVRLLPYFVFEIVYGTVIYRHFCTASVYYFSRYPDRRAWFLREAVSFFPVTVVFTVSMPLTCTLLMLLRTRIVFTAASFILLIYFILIHSLWLYFWTVCVNLLAIRFGSSTGFSIVASLQLLCISAMALWETTFSLDDEAHAARNAFLLTLNPVSHIILGWHSSAIAGVDRFINGLGISFELNISATALLAFNVMILFVGRKVVQKQEFIVVNRETGGI